MAETYAARKVTVDSIETVRLSDPAHGIEVSTCPSVGNIAYDMRVNGKPILNSPPSLPEWKKNPSQAGIPFLAPWANRLDADGYWANGKRYLLNPDAVEIRRDGNGLPIHGLLLFAADWQVMGLDAERTGRPGNQPPRFLEASGMDGPVPVRPPHSDDPSAVRRGSRSLALQSKTFRWNRCRW